MLIHRFVVCSERDQKPVSRVVCDSRIQAEEALLKIREDDADDPEEKYWIAELGPECETWRASDNQEKRVP